MCWLMALLEQLELRLQVFSDSIVTKSRVDMPMYVVFTSRERVNLGSALDFEAAKVLHLTLKCDPVFCEV